MNPEIGTHSSNSSSSSSCSDSNDNGTNEKDRTMSAKIGIRVAICDNTLNKWILARIRKVSDNGMYTVRDIDDTKPVYGKL